MSDCSESELKTKTIDNEKIDLVYLWVDGSDPKWREKKQKYSGEKELDKDAIADCRFIDYDELKFSIRSAEKNLPWINKIYIVADEQIPKWLDLNNDRVQVVDLKEIVPADKLPLFNSGAIEARLPFIPNLSEYFIYANDDMLFWNPADKDFFFDGERPICRLGERIKKKRYKHLYGHFIFKSRNLVRDRFGVDTPFFPHHNADAYKKSTYINCIKEFQKEFDIMLNNRFRDFSDIQRMIVSYYAIAKNEGIPKNVTLSLFDKLMHKTPDSEYFNVTKRNIKKIRNSKAILMCVNDSRKTTDEARSMMKNVLEEKFPNKSSFEKEEC